MATISGDLKTKFTDDLGEPLVGGKVYTYHAGTSTPKDSYQDKEFAIVNTNPIILDDAGSCDLYLNGLYRLRVLDKDGVFVEERDYMTQGDSTGSSITDNANNITVLQSEVQAINERSVLKLDENNFVIGHGSANSATVHDPAFRLDKLKIAKKDDAESAKLLFNTYENDTVVEGETVKEGSYIDPDLITQPLVKNWRDVERAALKGTKKDSKTNLLLKAGDSVPENSAASRLVGTGIGNLVEVPSAYGLLNAGYGGLVSQRFAGTTYDGETEAERSLAFRDYLYSTSANVGSGFYLAPASTTGFGSGTTPSIFLKGLDRYVWLNINHFSQEFKIISGGNTGELFRSSTVYTTRNTTLENGYLKPSSPVLRLSHDKIIKEHEAEDLDIKVENPKKGVYKITGTTGLRKDDGWYFSPPKDEHFNILCMVEIEEEGDTITVKTYAKKFDFEKVAIVPDYDNPVDIIGEVLLRFNDLPEEQLDEPIE